MSQLGKDVLAAVDRIYEGEDCPSGAKLTPAILRAMIREIRGWTTRMDDARRIPDVIEEAAEWLEKNM
jgi:hypothetical protein